MGKLYSLSKLSGISEESLQGFIASLKGEDMLKKAVTLSNGLIGYDLEKPAKQLVPMLSPMRNVIPRKTSTTGDSKHWKVILDIINGRATAAEGMRGGKINYVTEDRMAVFKSVGLQDSVTFEAEAAGKNFMDVRAMAGTNTLLKLMVNEEQLDIGGNIDNIENPTNVTGVAGGSGGNIPAGKYNYHVAALTIAGLNTCGVWDKQVKNLFIDPTHGVTLPVAGTAVDVAAGQTLTIACKPVKGAYAYAMFAGTGTETILQAVSSRSSFVLKDISDRGLKNSAITSNVSGDKLAYDGILPQIVKGDGYIIDGNNTKLTPSNGGIAELDELNSYAWGRYRIGYTRYICGAGMTESITNALLGNTSNSGGITQFVTNADKNNIVGNYLAVEYINKSVAGQKIKIESHPYLPNGTLIALPEVIPYPNNEVSNLLEKICGHDYRQIDYAQTSPAYEFEVRFYGCLVNYFPAACGILNNFAKAV